MTEDSLLGMQKLVTKNSCLVTERGTVTLARKGNFRKVNVEAGHVSSDGKQGVVLLTFRGRELIEQAFRHLSGKHIFASPSLLNTRI